MQMDACCPSRGRVVAIRCIRVNGDPEQTSDALSGQWSANRTYLANQLVELRDPVESVCRAGLARLSGESAARSGL